MSLLVISNISGSCGMALIDFSFHNGLYFLASLQAC